MEKVDYTVDGKCPENCGKCCSSILPISEYEIEKIKKYIQRNKIKPSTLNFDICPFLKEDMRCSVYVHRPEVCREFICNKIITKYNHRDKKIVNLWSEFYNLGNEKNAEAQNLDFTYQKKKKNAYGSK